ncbi:GM23008 [Drosophila sechellia]|uniref:GM23008 n=1 Tax=Drosophila sechellia TaxID=7238 RepID=B4I640_DROSE|nr:GM23008 [Drosophila sechellia]
MDRRFLDGSSLTKILGKKSSRCFIAMLRVLRHDVSQNQTFLQAVILHVVKARPSVELRFASTAIAGVAHLDDQS